MVIWN